MDYLLFYKPECPYCTKIFDRVAKEALDGVILVNIHEGNNRGILKDKGGKVQVPCLFIKGRPLYESEDIITWMGENL